MTTEDTLQMPEFSQGYLTAVSLELYKQVREYGEDDYWELIRNVPVSISPESEYKQYDLNFWYEEEKDKWHCTAYPVWRDAKGFVHTSTTQHLRLW